MIYIYLTLVTFFTLLGFNSLAQTSTNSNGELVINKDSMLKFLYKHSFEQYNVAPNIPKEFTEKKDKYEVPADETIMAFIDASIMGNAKFGIVIGLKGLYIYNSSTSASPGRKVLSYTTFKLAEVLRDNKHELSIGPVKLEIFGLSKDDSIKAETFFKDMKLKLLH